MNSIADFCRENWNDYCALTIKTADRVCENRFLFDSPWDLERTETMVSFGDKIDWNYKLNGDNEFMFQLNRHGYLIQLGQAYYLTGDEKYLRHFCRILDDWIDNVPLEANGDNPWRSLETGIRGDNWIKAIEYIRNTEYFTPALEEKLNKSLSEHVDVLKKAHTGFQKGSNWGIIQDSGLFQLGVYFGDNEIINTAIERLNQETDLQMMYDGVHWEQSSGYHNAVLMNLLDVIITADKNGVAIPENLRRKIMKMAEVNLYWIKPNGCHPLLGDSDNNNIRGIMCKCALAFKDGRFKSQGFKTLDYDSAWQFGIEGVKKYNELPVRENEFLTCCLNDSGNYVLRENNTEASNYLFFHNGYTGGGHSHGDKLHFDLMIKGRDVLVDGGRYSYMFNSKRKYLKSVKGHNTCAVDNREYLKMTSAWNVKTPAPAIQYPVFDNEFCTLIGGGHLGYLKSKGVYTERKILYIKPDIYVITDTFKARFYHTYQQYFHFAPSSSLTVSGKTAEFDDGCVKAKFHFLTPDIKIKKEKSFFSPNYNAVCDNDCIKTSFSAVGNCSAVTVIYGNKSEEFKPFTVSFVRANDVQYKRSFAPSQAFGVVIKTPDKEYTVLFAFKELKKVFECNGKVGSGSITVFCNDKMIFNNW